ncbi:hypothetical protein ACEPPN_011874 [Leptodophora sp. 'Broadleaf-Isolate-01']
MKSIIASSLLLSLLLRQATAVPSIEARQEVEIESVNLRYKSQCKRTSEISNAWDDAIRLATTLPKINWNEAAAVDFFGPPALNKNYQSKIQKVFDNAKTFGQGWKITPTPFKVLINVDCGSNPDSELDKTCAKDLVGAYTWNTKNTDGTGDKKYNNKGATMNMYVCNLFFSHYKPLDDRIKEFKDDANYKNKYSLKTYTNRDLDMFIYVWKEDDYGKWTRTLQRVHVYGAENTKILARPDQTDIGKWVSTNADNYSLYVLAKYVQSNIGAYPWLPVVNGQSEGSIIPKRTSQLVITNGSDWGLFSQNYLQSLKEGPEDLTFTVSEAINAGGDPDDENSLPALTNLGWISDDKYPVDYINEMKV